MGRLSLALFLAVGAGWACGGQGGGSTTGGSLIELRPVLGSDPPPCPKESPRSDETVLPERQEGRVVACLRLAEPIVDASDVRSASLADTSSEEPAVSMVLGRVGSANLDGFARRHQGERLAIVVDEQLVSAPTLRSADFAGRLQVTGLSKEKAKDLFERLNRRPG